MSLFLLPLICLLTTCLCFWQKGSSRAAALLKGWLVFWIVIAFSTEFLSFFHLIIREVIFAFWLVYFAVSLVCILKNRNNLSRDMFIFHPPAWIFSAVVFVSLLTLICGTLYIPNNWDSQTFHLARISMWIQNASVDFYPTCIERQNIQLPLAEFGILHLQILSQSDRFAFLIQWFSFLCCLTGVHSITGILGGSKKAQCFSVLTAAVLPMGLFQSSSTQNDLVVTSFLCIFISLMLRFSAKLTLWTACALGLALLTKGTAYICTFIIGCGFGLYRLFMVPISERKKMFLCLCAAALGSLLFSLPFYARTFASTGTPLSGGKTQYFVSDPRPQVLAANLIRHIANHAAPPHFGSPVSRLMTSVLYRIFPASINSRHSTRGTTVFRMGYFPHEDSAGNFYHFLLYLLCCILVFSGFVKPQKEQPAVFRLYVGVLLLSWFVPCTILFWSPWSSRYDCLFFFPFAPVAAICIEYLSQKRQWVMPLAGAVLFLLNADVVFRKGFSRPLRFPLIQQDFASREQREDIRKMAEFVRRNKIAHVGVVCGRDENTVYAFTRLLGCHADRRSGCRVDYDNSAEYVLFYHHGKPIPENCETVVRSSLCSLLHSKNTYR